MVRLLATALSCSSLSCTNCSNFWHFWASSLVALFEEPVPDGAAAELPPAAAAFVDPDVPVAVELEEDALAPAFFLALPVVALEKKS